jgi:serine O-acetyltransferase
MTARGAETSEMLVRQIRLVAALRCLPLLLPYSLLAGEPRVRLDKDIAVWSGRLDVNYSRGLAAVSLLAGPEREFRNLFFYRLSRGGMAWAGLAKLLAVIWHPVETLKIWTPDVGGGLYIQHGFGTVLAALKIGENCSVNHQVTLGYDGVGRAPTLGDRIGIGVGAIVIGRVHVGDDAMIGAGAVVVHDVAAGATVVGVPAKQVR